MVEDIGKNNKIPKMSEKDAVFVTQLDIPEIALRNAGHIGKFIY